MLDFLGAAYVFVGLIFAGWAFGNFMQTMRDVPRSERFWGAAFVAVVAVFLWPVAVGMRYARSRD